jgi:hypothetical protein
MTGGMETPPAVRLTYSARAEPLDTLEVSRVTSDQGFGKKTGNGQAIRVETRKTF